FFSSRRRHTRFSRDWSSDVCSSDLAAHGSVKSYLIGFVLAVILTIVPFMLAMNGYFTPGTTAAIVLGFAVIQVIVHLVYFLHLRSEERRVGKECRARVGPYHMVRLM